MSPGRREWRLVGELAVSARLVDAEGDPLHVHPHRLRASFMELLLDNGVSLAATQDASWHASAYAEHPTHRLNFTSSDAA